MSAENPSSPQASPNGSTKIGFPPVQPPTGRHIIQMFVAPGMIVACLIGLALLFTYGCGAPRSADEFIKELDSPTDDVRWRAADDLAKTLPRSKELAANADFALAIADRLDRGLKRQDEDEKALMERLAKIKDPKALAEERKKLRGDAGFNKLQSERNYLLFLTGALGHFSVPVGVPVLRQMAEQEEGVEPRELAHRRMNAVHALANLGERLQSQYDPAPDITKDQIRSQLQHAIDRGDHADWAQLALDHLEGRRKGAPTAMGIDHLAEVCADPRHTDPMLRQDVALSLNFWYGNDAENARMDHVLLGLTHDSGAGTEFLVAQAADEDRDFRPIQESTALDVRFAANTALARRGRRKCASICSRTCLTRIICGRT